MFIPKVIHQVFEGRNGEQPSKLLLELAKTWKENNPDWEYRFWNYKHIDQFLLDYFPHLIEKYHDFRYDVQRWDYIRYLILYQFGGIYVDLDYECLEPIDNLIDVKTCCFGLEPLLHCKIFNKEIVVGNAFMGVVPEHPFFKKIIEVIPTLESMSENKMEYVLETTGPHMLTLLYEDYKNKSELELIPAELVAPLNKNEVQQVLIDDIESEEINQKIQDAYAVHYFFGSWLKSEN